MDFETQQKPKDVKTVPVDATVAVVRLHGARMMAFQDNDGVWRDYFDGRHLPPDIEILQILQSS